MAMDVSATGLQSFRQVALVFLGTGNLMVCLKHVAITDSIRDMLEMSVKTPASWSAHARSTHPGNPSGLGIESSFLNFHLTDVPKVNCLLLRPRSKDMHIIGSIG
jgi:hypothetical protein